MKTRNWKTFWILPGLSMLSTACMVNQRASVTLGKSPVIAKVQSQGLAAASGATGEWTSDCIPVTDDSSARSQTRILTLAQGQYLLTTTRFEDNYCQSKPDTKLDKGTTQIDDEKSPQRIDLISTVIASKLSFNASLKGSELELFPLSESGRANPGTGNDVWVLKRK